MATYAYDDFEMSFVGRGGGYQIEVTCPDGATISKRFTIPLSTDELEQTIMTLARSSSRKASTRKAGMVAPATDDATTDAAATNDALSVGPATREVGAAEVVERDVRDDEAERIGAVLADALFDTEVGSAYDAARRDSVANGRGLRLTLTLGEAPELLNLPWEFLYRRPRFLASHRHTPLVRRLQVENDDAPPDISGQVRILGVVSAPTNLKPLDTAQERRRVEEAVSSMVDKERVQLDWLEPATPGSLRKALRDDEYHVLHYVGHSALTPAGDGALFLEDASGAAAQVDHTVFANLLADQTSLRLVVLNSCEGARTTIGDPYAGIATTLIQLGVPAVVAMQFEISDPAAILFADELYTNLIGRQDPIDAAVAEARKAIYVEVDQVEWATPVLFVRDPDIELFRFAPDVKPLPPPPPPDIDPRLEPLFGEPDDAATTDGAAPGDDGASTVTDGAVATDAPSTVVDGVVAADVLADGSGDADEGIATEQTEQTEQGGDDTVREDDVILRDDDGQGGRWKRWVVVGAVVALLATAGAFLAVRWNEGREAPADPTIAPITVAPTDPRRTFDTTPVDTTGRDTVPPDTTRGVTPPVTTEATGDTTPQTQATTASTPPGVGRPRPPTDNLAFALVQDSGDVHIKSYDEATGTSGNVSDRPGAADGEMDWQAGTSRLAFTRTRPADGAGIRINYAADGDSAAGIPGKFVRPLIPWGPGIHHHAPAWGAAGDLFYADAGACAPGQGCAETIRRATFDVTADDDGYLDELVLTDDRIVGAGFTDVLVVAAHPIEANVIAIADQSGVWLMDASTGDTLPVVAGALVLSMDFTGDGQYLVGVGFFDGGASWAMVDLETGEAWTVFPDDPNFAPSWISVTAEGERGLIALSATELVGAGTVLARFEVADDVIDFVDTIPDDRLPAGAPLAVDR